MRILGCAFIIFTCMLIGRTLAQGYVERVRNLNQFILALEILKSKIQYGQEVLEDSFNSIGHALSNKVGKVFSEAFMELYKEEKSISEIWNSVVENDFKNLDFTFEDEEVLLDFGNLLGSSDIESQITNIELTVSRLGRQLKMAEQDKFKYAKLYRTIGCIGGTALAIIII